MRIELFAFSGCRSYSGLQINRHEAAQKDQMGQMHSDSEATAEIRLAAFKALEAQKT